MTVAVRDKLLTSVQEPFELNKTDTARLFGVSRQAVDAWHESGVPPARQEKAATVAAIADLLSKRLKSERIPGVARRPADAYGGLTMLEMIQCNRHAELLALTRGSFDWSATL
jgi:phage terminase Nu1 subunit (DNA packaging protein)